MRTDDLFDLHPGFLFPGIAAAIIAAMLINSQGIILTLAKPALMTVAFTSLFVCSSRIAGKLSDNLATRFQARYPTFILWLFPTSNMFIITIAAYVFLTLSSKILGRDFWSTCLGLTGQDTTTFFFGSFVAMLFFISSQFVFSMHRVYRWIIEISRNHIDLLAESEINRATMHHTTSLLTEVMQKSEELKNERLKTTRLNRLALLFLFFGVCFFFCWIVFFRPELILYYRAEIQLRSFIEPQTAYNTLLHLSEKYPDYHYIDSVHYRMAWILDRRLKEPEKAREAYEKFLSRFGYKNIWSDEAVTSLVRLSLDQFDIPHQTLHWTKIYLDRYPNRIMVPHMYLYRIRAFIRLGNTSAAASETEKAKNSLSNKRLPVINSEDRLVALIDFSEVLAAESGFELNRFRQPAD
jgi:hypothetical protein